MRTLKYILVILIIFLFTSCTETYNNKKPEELETYFGKVVIDTTQYTKAYIKDYKYGVIIVANKEIKKISIYTEGQFAILYIIIVLLFVALMVLITTEN
jgi:hypothetical protein